MNSILFNIAELAPPSKNGLDLNQYLIQHPAATFFMRAENGDLLIVDRALSPQPNNMVIAVINGEFCLHRVPIKPSKMEIWGVVTYSIHDFL